jgi:hypothetical protein
MNRFEFRSASGEVCCSSDNPEHLCAKCKAKAHTQRHAASDIPDPNYDPHGTPASGYDIALNRQAPKPNPRNPFDSAYDPRKTTPDGYAIALAKKAQGELR